MHYYLTVLMVLLVKRIFLTIRKIRFQILSNCDSNATDSKYDVLGKLENFQCGSNNMIVISENICKLIEKLKCRKDSGSDDIRAESLKFAHDRLHVCCLYVFQLLFFLPQSLPQSLLETSINDAISKRGQKC